MRFAITVLLYLACGFVLRAQAPDRTHGRSMVISTGGIVATSQVLASQAGAMILAQGGSAVDAAIAANAVLGVTEPMMCGIGGDLFVLYRDAKTGKLTGLNASGPAPREMTIEALQAKGLKTMARDGILSATVPGTVRGWDAMHRRYGKLPWKDLFTPAIRLAEQGFPVYEIAAAYWEHELIRKNPESARVYRPNGRAPRTGDLFRNPDLASAIRLIAEEGADAFYKGGVARAIVATSAKLGGPIAAGDLESYEPEWVTPISTTYRGWRLHELPPNAQGLAALTMLNILETFQPGPSNSAEELHRKIEAMKLAYADLHYVADTRTVKVPTSGIIDKGYAAARAKLIDSKKANCDVKAGSPPGSSDTTYLTVVDQDGNIVSWIQSISGLWGSGVTVEGMGFPLHNRGGSFQFDKSHPNALVPGKRPFHTIIPAIVERGDVHIGFGIMGGPNQPLAHAQYVSYLADYGLDIQAALSAPRFTKGSATGCGVVYVETRFGLEAFAGLSKLGHQLSITREYSAAMGRGNAVLHNSATKMNFAASDPRADGAAIPEPVR